MTCTLIMIHQPARKVWFFKSSKDMRNIGAVEVVARGSWCMAIAAPAAPLDLFQFYNHQSLHNDVNWPFFVQPIPLVSYTSIHKISTTALTSS